MSPGEGAGTPRGVKTYPLLGVAVDALTVGDLGDIVEGAAEKDGRCVIGHHNLHSLYAYHHDPTIRGFYERADYVHIDGMPLVWAGKLLGYPLGRRNRLTSVDWLPSVLARCAARNLRVFFLGSRPGVAEKAAAHFIAGNPGLRLKTHHGYFDATPGSAESERVLRLINAYRPHALMVGMGVPRQERWIAGNADRLEANTVWSLGAFMDYYAGEIPTPPRWMGRSGFEWLYRLLSEPRRLWKRYLLEPPFALKLLITELARRRLRTAGR